MEQKIHRDVLETIILSQIKRFESGEVLTNEEMAEVIALRNTTLYEDIEEARKLAVKFGNMVLELQKDHTRVRRIYDLFLQNHGLYDEFENFYIRILDRLYRDK